MAAAHAQVTSLATIHQSNGVKALPGTRGPAPLRTLVHMCMLQARRKTNSFGGRNSLGKQKKALLPYCRNPETAAEGFGVPPGRLEAV